jgi:hypothetical protein
MIGPLVNLYAGWLAMLGGAVSGAAIGLFFHQTDWLGGYPSFRRRLVRLGHISFFGLGFLNLLFALTAGSLQVGETAQDIASILFIIGVVSMPTCCFLSAWRSSASGLFVIPVVSVVAGIVAVLIG